MGNRSVLHHCEMPQDLDGNTTSLDSYSLTVLPEALSRQSKDSHSSIDKAELEHRPILTILKTTTSGRFY